MYYAITHLTIYKYSEPITDSVMELRMHPRSDRNQRQISFNLEVSPAAKTFSYRDYLGNTLHTFDIPARHESLAIRSESIVEIKAPPPIPESLLSDAWAAIDEKVTDRDFFDMLLAGTYAKMTPLLAEFATEIDWKRRDDPLSLLKELNSTIYEKFDYRQNFTQADSPIDKALQARLGVCQDFTHIMLALVRSVGIPARYMSGYLAHSADNDRSDADASHAWVEAWLPDIGWLGFDPTNNLIVTDRHIGVSIANDYADASPSRGVFKGKAETELEVRVQVSQLDELPIQETQLTPDIVMPHYDYTSMQEQQQQ